jgi:hypothetical protein
VCTGLGSSKEGSCFLEQLVLATHDHANNLLVLKQLCCSVLGAAGDQSVVSLQLGVPGYTRSICSRIHSSWRFRQRSNLNACSSPLAFTTAAAATVAQAD